MIILLRYFLLYQHVAVNNSLTGCIPDTKGDVCIFSDVSSILRLLAERIGIYSKSFYNAATDTEETIWPKTSFTINVNSFDTIVKDVCVCGNRSSVELVAANIIAVTCSLFCSNTDKVY